VSKDAIAVKATAVGKTPSETKKAAPQGGFSDALERT
jgi:hypothetical protein